MGGHWLVTQGGETHNVSNVTLPISYSNGNYARLAIHYGTNANCNVIIGDAYTNNFVILRSAAGADAYFSWLTVGH